jgi:hypothetical protein
MNNKAKTIIKKLVREELNLIESFDILNNTPKQIIKHVGNDTSGFNNSEEAEEEIENLINMDFPYGFKNIPNEVILYRVLLLKDGESVNEENVGEHFISESNLIDIGFLEKIGVLDNWSEDARLWLLTCQTSRDNINIERTIGNRLIYPREYEFTLYNNSKIKIIDKKELKRNDLNY